MRVVRRDCRRYAARSGDVPAGTRGRGDEGPAVSRARSLLVEAEHAATERRVIVLLRPPLAVTLDSEPAARCLELVEVDPAALIVADKFDPIVATLSQLVTSAACH